MHMGEESIPKKCYTQKWRENDQEENPEPYRKWGRNTRKQ